MLPPGLDLAPQPFRAVGVRVWLELMPPLLRVCAGIAYRIAIAHKNCSFTLGTFFPFAFALHMMEEFDIFFRFNFVVTKVIVVVGCHNFNQLNYQAVDSIS